MFRRKAYDQLVEWKRSSGGRTAMLIEGARRVGKSTIAEEFARNEYNSYALVDFTKVGDEFRRTLLDTRGDLDSFFLYLSATLGVTLTERKSLVIFDEVQLFPPAREFIKHLVADGRYDFIETGSLISINENVKDILIPSEEESMKMGPLDFEEFLWAMGEEALAQMITNSFASGSPLPDSLHRKASRLWREYVLVGGMPQSVAAYAPNRDMAAADRAKRMVLKIYREDIEKYGGMAAKRIRAVFDAIPGQLSKHEKRLVYTQVENGSRSRDFMTAFSWMREAATVNLCTLAEDPSIGLALSADDATVKCYMADTGLLSTMAFSASGSALPEVYRQVLLGADGVNEGMLAENAVAQQLTASGHDLYFYSKSSSIREERMEIDFLIIRPYPDAAMKPRVSPVEVKSGKRYSTVSLDKFHAKFTQRAGEEYVLHPRQMSQDGIRRFLPLYMSFCL
ncbi:ATPase [Bifidobacterium sp. UTCIF-3]|uniref:ATP-binding protein n=1 Tax=unclassified Bifidobacterium TaxID=2608897 RepID=UPI00112C6F5E|nr:MULTISPECIES: AAA family ATPase [unclassified Bifidobacterium]TPF78431.1 ATPase [Bifidobacterium sp. UTCIF-1]TPF79804.1 ATPase [Bifidobacterium sp. UTCIF-24]TPF82184.1 ATPase [Bifidobacterium sp. UTCIF-3]TPF84839.1 ATPase [Bifidobacterium sp. UTCIF-36]